MRRVPLSTFLTGVLSCACILVACGDDHLLDPPEDFRNQTIDWHVCDPTILGEDTGYFDVLGDRIRCADIRIPLDHADPRKGAAILALLRVRAENTDAHRGAILFNPGGPGEDGLDLAAEFGDLWANGNEEDPQGKLFKEMSRTYDLIGFSPRGTGASTILACESNELMPIKNHPSDRSPSNIAAMLAEGKLIAKTCQKNPLAPYINTWQTAHDMDLVRHLLGNEKLNYIGYSYGTWLGSWYASLFPERVGRMLLDSNLNLASDLDRLGDNQIYAMQRLLDDIIPAYALRHTKELAFGDASDDISELFGTFPLPLKTALIEDQIPLGWSGRIQDVVLILKGSQLLSVFLKTHADATEDQVRQWIEDVDLSNSPDVAKRRQTLHFLYDQYLSKLNPVRENIQLSRMIAVLITVHCNDVPWNSDPQHWVDRGNESAQQYSFLGGLQTAGVCMHWGPPSATRPALAAANQAGPILLIQSEFDALTPAAPAFEGFKALENGYLIFVANEYTHAVFPYGTSCVDEPVLRYFLEGTLPPRRTDCEGKGYPLESVEELLVSNEAAFPPGPAGHRSPWRDPQRAKTTLQKIHDTLAHTSTVAPFMSW